jgi:hypothetical protein
MGKIFIFMNLQALSLLSDATARIFNLSDLVNPVWVGMTPAAAGYYVNGNIVASITSNIPTGTLYIGGSVIATNSTIAPMTASIDLMSIKVFR